MSDTEQNPPDEVNDQSIETTQSDQNHEEQTSREEQPIKTQFGLIKKAQIVTEMERSYLDYAMSVIVSRALPDVRDGLKPVHRRILYGMRAMGIHWNSGYKKSARIVGEVLGKFHPHGDSAVYDALVRMAQDFNMRYPLVDGQGNFGSIDGDSAAAMRYTEARISRISEELLTDIEKKTVPFTDNFDGSQQEPEILPAKLPNLLLMGSEGIAVGMATKIPPHNLNEICSALIAMIDQGTATYAEGYAAPKDEEGLQAEPAEQLAGQFRTQYGVDEILEHVHGPDFPTGGVIYDWTQIKDAYQTGRGRIIMRAVASIEETKANKFQIIITQLPYQVNKAKLVAKIATLARDKKIVGISDLRDESDRDGLRIAIDLKKDAKPKSVLNNLYKYTELQTTFPMNMVALNAEGTPQLMNIKQVLMAYLKHRQIVIVRRAQFDLKAARDRAHILEGLLIALANLDDVIETIRKSPDSDTARTRLMERFKLSELQAIAILDMQLRRLAALERQKIEDEYKQIKATIATLCTLLGNPVNILAAISTELGELKEKFGDARRSKLHKGKIGEFNEEDLIANEPTIITITETGYVKRLKPDTYRTQHRGGIGVTGMTTKEEDAIKMIVTAETHDTLLVFSNKGRVFKIKAHELPESSRQAKGTSIVNLVNFDAEERLQTVLPMGKDIANKFIVLATKNGLVKKTKLEDFANIRTTGIIAIILKKGDELVFGQITTGQDHLMLISKSGKSIRFPESEIKTTARDTQGVRAIALKGTDIVIGVETILADDKKNNHEHLLVVTTNGMGKRSPLPEYPVQKRAGQGVKVAEITKKTGEVAAAMMVDETCEELVITTKSAQIIKLPLKNVPILKRPTQGVILMRFSEKDDSVVSVAVTRG